MKLKRRRMEATVPSMAMGDIAFNLLIFFVILARAQDDSHLQWTPAELGTVKAAGHSVVSIVIDEDAKLYLNGGETGTSGLTASIKDLLQPYDRGERTVLLKVHRETPAQVFEPVVEAIGQAGGELVHIVEERPK